MGVIAPELFENVYGGEGHGEEAFISPISAPGIHAVKDLPLPVIAIETRLVPAECLVSLTDFRQSGLANYLYPFLKPGRADADQVPGSQSRADAVYAIHAPVVCEVRPFERGRLSLLARHGGIQARAIIGPMPLFEQSVLQELVKAITGICPRIGRQPALLHPAEVVYPGRAFPLRVSQLLAVGACNVGADAVSGAATNETLTSHRGQEAAEVNILRQECDLDCRVIIIPLIAKVFLPTELNFGHFASPYHCGVKLMTTSIHEC